MEYLNKVSSIIPKGCLFEAPQIQCVTMKQSQACDFTRKVSTEFMTLILDCCRLFLLRGHLQSEAKQI